MAENEIPYRSPESDELAENNDSTAHELVTVASYWWDNEAQIARMHLESFGIRTFMAGEMTASMFWHYSNAVGGIRLQVAECDAERARELLSADVTLDDERERAAFADEPDDPPLNSREQNADRALRGAMVGIFLPPLQLYALWLLITVFISDQPLRNRQRRNAIAGAVICGVFGAFWYLFFSTLVPSHGL
jgi:hypothetical protein